VRDEDLVDCWYKMNVVWTKLEDKCAERLESSLLQGWLTTRKHSAEGVDDARSEFGDVDLLR